MTTKTKDKTFGLNYKREFYIKVEGKQLRVNDYGDKSVHKVYKCHFP